MNLDGWDTCSIVSIDLVNQALQKEADRTIRTFSYSEDGLEISGEFDGWALAPNGTFRLVNVTLPIRSGTIREAGAAEVDISGVTLTAQLKLSLIDSEDPDKRNLAFDTSHQEGKGESGLPIKVTDINDPTGLLEAFDLELVKAALTECLSANASQASYVFASVDARSTSKAEGLACPANDWAFVDAGENRQYLALLGSLDKERLDKAIRLSPSLMTPAAPAYFAVSQRLFLSRALLPILQQTFRPRTSFAVKGNAVQSTKPVGLGKKKIAMFTVAPVLKKVTVTQVKNALAISALARADLPLSTHLDVTVSMKLPFQHDPKTGAMSFKPDPNPIVKHKLNKSGIMGHTLGLIINLIVALSKKAIMDSVRNIATGMQAMNNPTTEPVVWTGVRDFHTSKARFDDGIWMADTRPVTVVEPEKTHEPA